MYKRAMLIMVAFIWVFLGVAQASEVPDGKLKQFQKGTPAVAAEVNANFESLRQAINDNSRRLNGGNLIPNANFDNGLGTGWSADANFSRPTATFNLLASANAPAGANYVVANQDGGVLWLKSDTWITIDPAQTYEVSGWFHRSSAEGTSGNVYLAVLSRDKDGNLIPDSSHWWYYPAIGEVPGANWVRYEGIFGNGTRNPFPSAAVEMTVGAILNYNNSNPGDRVFQTVGLGIQSIQTPGLWQNLQLETGKTRYFPGAQIPQYRKIADMVCLRGLVQTTGTAKGPIAYLPYAYSPGAGLLIFGTAGETSAWGGDRVDVSASGSKTLIEIVFEDGSTLVSLDQICWSVAP